MVNKQHNDIVQEDLDVTTTATDEIVTEPELEETEDFLESKVKKLQTKLREAEEKQQHYHEELQRGKADFLNAKRRLEDERLRDKERAVEQLIERLLPLCDSFHLAKTDKAMWEKADPIWRKGIEGIEAQLMAIMSQYNVTTIDPTGETFDPLRHEALSTEVVPEADRHNTVTTVMQLGYIRTIGNTVSVLRPARVVVAEYLE